jgi:nitrate/nitrite transport system substrate-binding protein
LRFGGGRRHPGLRPATGPYPQPAAPSSWAGLRDKLVSGELDAAHCLYGLVYAVQLGMGGGPASDMAVLMGLNQNAQAINLSAALQRKGVTNPEALARLAHQGGAPDLRPDLPHRHPRHVAVLLAGQPGHPPVAGRRQRGGAAGADGRPPAGRAHRRLCVGEPWSPAIAKARASPWPPASRSGRITRKRSWPARAFVEQYPNSARALIKAILAASRFIEQRREPSWRRAAAQWQRLSGHPASSIEPRLLGDYRTAWATAGKTAMPCACSTRAANLPYLSDGMWFMTQFRRWGILRDDPDYLAVAPGPAAGAVPRGRRCLGVPCADLPMRSSQLIDGSRWDGSDPPATRAASTCTPWTRRPTPASA